MFSLIYTERGEPRRYTLETGDTIVGRSATCDLVIDDASVSRRQATLTVMGNYCKLVDLGSRNGTFVNSNAVTEAELSDGDTVVFGTFPVHVERSEEDRLALSEDHALIESSSTIYRPIEPDLKKDAAEDTPLSGRGLLRTMSEISRALVQPESLIAVLNTVVDLAFRSVPAERAFLMLRDEAGAAVVPRVVRSRDGALLARTSISRTIVNRVMQERMAILARDAQMDTRLAGVESILSANVRSFMCAPLWNQQEVIGVFYVDNPQTREFTSMHLDLFTALSGYAAVAIEQARLTARVLEETRRRERLQRYHSPAVIDRILQEAGDANIPMMAQERDVSVLFADIVGFTQMSEQMEPAEVARVLNRCFARMSDVIFEHEGTLDKFIGDAVLAVFGAPLDQPDHARRAVRAAVAMRRALDELNVAESEQRLELRIAVNSGIATAGDIGSPKRREYTVLGDVVNTCSRIQSSLCAPQQIVIAKKTAMQLDGEFAVHPLGSFKLRGRKAEVEVFEVEAAS
jgi:adenylate cyclase